MTSNSVNPSGRLPRCACEVDRCGGEEPHRRSCDRNYRTATRCRTPEFSCRPRWVRVLPGWTGGAAGPPQRRFGSVALTADRTTATGHPQPFSRTWTTAEARRLLGLVAVADLASSTA